MQDKTIEMQLLNNKEIKLKKKKKSVRTVSWIMVIIFIISSFGVAGYPYISDLRNSRKQKQETVQYLDYIAETPVNKYEDMIASAREYNKKLVGKTAVGDPFTGTIQEPEDYYRQLSIPQTDVMATVEIPKINVNLPVFHGTSADVLTNGAGHVAYSSLPVGGKGCHSVLSAHTGYSTQRFFTDLESMELGDVFYVRCFGEEMAYKVDKIKVVLPDNSSDLQILPDKDYCTLITCTPFGINSHRLLVRGTRIDISEADKIKENTETVDSVWDKEYQKALMLGLAATGFVLLIFMIIRMISGTVKNRKRTKNGKTN